MIIRKLIFLFITLLACDAVTGIDDFNFGNPSDENFSEETKAQFQRNATILAYRHQSVKNSSFIGISDELKTFYYDLLITVANSEDGQEQGVTTNTYIFESANLHELIVNPTSDSPFIPNWKDSLITTNIESIDQLLADNNFYIKDEFNWSHTESSTFLLHREEPINTLSVGKQLEETGFFNYAESNGYIGDGSTILVDIKNKFIDVSYSVAYGDCPAGCINEDFYTFRVSKAGEVSYLGKNIDR